MHLRRRSMQYEHVRVTVVIFPRVLIYFCSDLNHCYSHKRFKQYDRHKTCRFAAKFTSLQLCLCKLSFLSRYEFNREKKHFSFVLFSSAISLSFSTRSTATVMLSTPAGTRASNSKLRRRVAGDMVSEPECLYTRLPVFRCRWLYGHICRP